jgi:DNA-binding winged helix-turn-helix (wHTH) protein/TolB-like protein/Flp pilus assembly protein TadD
MSKKAACLYEFGPFRLDVSEHRLLRNQEVVPLSPKVFETLLVLVEHSGHVLEKDKLMRTLWPDSFVEESSLMQNISLLRKALGEGGEQQFIETVPKHGYRFVAPVKVLEVNNNGSATEELVLTQQTETAVVIEDEEHDEEAADDKQHLSNELPIETHPALSESQVDHKGYKLSHLGGAAFLLLAILIGGVYFWRAKTFERKDTLGISVEGRARSLAVLPFKPLGSESNDEYLGLGVADALIIKLSNFDQFSVRPTSSVIKYAGHEYDAQSVGKELGVETVLGGTLQRAGERVRVTVTLLSIRDGKMLWSAKFDERFTDIFALQDSISERVANVLQLQLAQGKQSQLNKRFTENAEAYRYYTMGLYFWNKRTKEGLRKAIDYFQKAIETDPNYALAYAMLADTYHLTLYYDYDILPPMEALSKAEDLVVRALELDDTLAEAHATMGSVRNYKKDFAGARQSYKRAIELNPNSIVAHYRYAFALLAMLELKEAIREMQSAQELDPVSPTINTTLAACFTYTGQYDEAIRYSKMALEIDPQFGWARANLGEAYEWKTMYEEASTEYRKLTEQQGFQLYGKLGLASVNARLGRPLEAQRLLAEVENQFKSDEAFTELPFQIALIHSELGENDEAFVWLERAIKSRRARRFDLRYSHQLNALKNDPRYEQILRRYEYTKSFLSELSKQSVP